ncbi:MAG: Copper resistance protein B [Luteibacter sp.]|uniref:copper resistance protein B n=1 Tax=Luteibacter sp. TaxID=1886636 RepID=UPI0013854A4D|nr:copper resistance protein B [Luteibacter sp.]KAF1007458.1 MAG: Copper resistance protein B [Luteibacter sp.]
MSRACRYLATIGLAMSAFATQAQEMQMGAMQGGKAPADARSPDYSDGIDYGSMAGMDMDDNGAQRMVLLDQLEAVHGRAANGQSWEAQGWYGGDINRLWVRTEGERSGGRLEEADVEALWSRAISTYWNTQLGARQDFGTGPNRTWAAVGVQGLAPYWFETEATFYVSAGGRTAARLRAEYDLLLTQRLILQPEFEVNAYGKADRRQGVGSGLSDAPFGLRLRYEVRREFAPYIGIRFVDRFGRSADMARSEGQPVFDRQIVAGIQAWF